MKKSFFLVVAVFVFFAGAISVSAHSFDTLFPSKTEMAMARISARVAPLANTMNSHQWWNLTLRKAVLNTMEPTMYRAHQIGHPLNNTQEALLLAQKMFNRFTN